MFLIALAAAFRPGADVIFQAFGSPAFAIVLVIRIALSVLLVVACKLAAWMREKKALMRPPSP
jgi:hypothetical protein